MLKPIVSLLPAPLQIEARRYKLRWLNADRFRHYQKLRQSSSETGYSLQAFDRCKCIYVHIPKCAGISVSKSLFDSKAGGHLSISDYELIFSREEFEKYFKFAFVRNPWDRLYSAYTFMKKGGRHAGDQRWAERHLLPYDDFESFVEGWVTPENVQLSTHFRPQSDYLLSATGENSVDFIGTFENLISDFNAVKQRLGIDTELLSLNTTKAEPTLKKVNFRDHYTPKMRQIVTNVYAKDIGLLNYTFDNS